MPNDVLNEFVRFYRECRVTGAPILDGYDADTLCIECGNYWKVIALQIDDFRGRGDVGYQSGAKELQLSIHRTVFAVDALPKHSQFGDYAFEMDITMFFGPTNDDASFILEESTMEQLDLRLLKLSRDPLVSRLLAQTPRDSSAHVGGAT